MICRHGHGFDFLDGSKACPICGDPITDRIAVRLIWVSRGDFAVIQAGLRAGRILASVAVKAWPQVVAAQELILKAEGRTLAILDRDRDRDRTGEAAEKKAKRKANRRSGKTLTNL